MSRTIRSRPKGMGPAKDGHDIRALRGCRNHGSCQYCAEGRAHASRRRAPIDVWKRRPWKPFVKEPLL